ncbi:VOC family protein [Lutibacter sp.]|uniref:VOC family protein n=1 Tax=Lutibacter sp. TaxID=1925666 RepID=UPI0025BA63D1|nr:VOC family protein [Lutibacter sp.]MCF6181597.1 VOC family protein [Lutibacter sp.]
MKLNHIGLNVQSKDELVDFYQNILGFNFEYQFALNSVFATIFFGIIKQPEVFLYKKENLHFELFIYSENAKMGFAHLCLEVTNRKIIAKRSENAGYPITRIQRNDKPDIIFIKDKARNIFELKIENNENLS